MQRSKLLQRFLPNPYLITWLFKIRIPKTFLSSLVGCNLTRSLSGMTNICDNRSFGQLEIAVTLTNLEMQIPCSHINQTLTELDIDQDPESYPYYH